MKPEKNDDFLRARLEDAVEKCARGSVATLGFLTPREQRVCERILQGMGQRSSAFFWGGYDDAERVCLFLLPDYLTAVLPGAVADSPASEVLSLLGDAAEAAVCSVCISGSGFHTLSHRDYLGALLALGIERDALGDIAMQNEREAVVFTSQKIGAFLLSDLERIGADTVHCSLYQMNPGFTDGKRYEPLSRTVASPRLDCVVAALTDLSREAAQKKIKEGAVELEFEPEERIDRLVEPPVILSVRGYGRYVLRAFDGRTRRDRLRLFAEHLV